MESKKFGGPVNAFANLRITAVSPDRSVTAWMSHRDSFGIEFDETQAERHTESALGTQVAAAISGTRTGHQHALDRIAEMAGQRGRSDKTAVVVARNRSRQERADNCHDLKVRVMSPRGCVCVTIRGAGEVQCQIKPGTVSNGDITLSQLAQEIASTYIQAKNRHLNEVREAAGQPRVRNIGA